LIVNSEIINSIKLFGKYGWHNFQWEVIYQSYDYEHCLKTMENYFINEYNSFVAGYNSTLGGKGTLGVKKIISEQTQKNEYISNWSNKIK
jgi:hypothetical protein